MKRASEAEALVGNPPIQAPKGWQSVLVSLRERVASAFTKLGVNRRRTLRLCESLSLGEKRMIAIVECEGQRLLLAATPQNISLLQSLGPAQPEERQNG
jgi:flagellar biogenesis protein FliO